MAPLKEFTFFSKLPAELRLNIWELTPHPQRIIGLLPCPRCCDEYWYAEESGSLHPNHVPHPNWDLRLVVQPRNQLVLPALHACAESRMVMLRQGKLLPRYTRIVSRADHYVPNDVPYINYKSDIFTVYSPWSDDHDPIEPAVAPTEEHFAGCDTTRIQHIAISDSVLDDPDILITYLRDNHFNDLRNVSLLRNGPSALTFKPNFPRHLGNEELHLTQTDCVIRDIPFSVIELNHSGGLLSSRDESMLESVNQELNLLKACFWHIQNCSPSELGANKYRDFQFHCGTLSRHIAGLYGQDCPLPYGTCRAGGHTREEMLEGPAGIHVDCKLVCDKDWMEHIEVVGLFDSESSNSSDEAMTKRAKGTVAAMTGRLEGKWHYGEFESEVVGAVLQWSDAADTRESSRITDKVVDMDLYVGRWREAILTGIEYCWQWLFAFVRPTSPSLR